jgi:hypothetical protein
MIDADDTLKDEDLAERIREEVENEERLHRRFIVQLLHGDEVQCKSMRGGE